jgi:hypothetical protein
MRVAEVSNGVKEGNRYGGRVVLGKPFSVGTNSAKDTIWSVVAQCDCCDVAVVRTNNFLGERSRHCEKCSRIHKAKKHGEAGSGVETKLYQVWKAMRTRCRNPNAEKYPQYGGRGICICREWDTFTAFRLWAIQSGYVTGLTIDRIDNDGNYEPKNCQWLTKSANSAKRKTDREKKLASVR